MRYFFVLATLVLALTAHARDLYTEYESAKFNVGEKTITAFVADDDEKRSQGLMFIERLGNDEGMLFVFKKEQILSFWMKNTVIPLSIGFFDSKGVLIDIKEMSVPPITEEMPPSYQSRAPALFALEMRSGWFAKNKITNGAKLSLRGTTKSSLLNKHFSQMNKKPLGR